MGIIIVSTKCTSSVWIIILFIVDSIACMCVATKGSLIGLVTQLIMIILSLTGLTLC